MSSSIKSSLTLPLESKISDVYPLIVLLRPDWSLINIHLCRLTGGISNVAFVVSNDFDQSDTFVIKIYGLKTEEFIDHNAGLITLSILSNYGFAQPILLQFTNGIIYKFIPGTVCTENTMRDIHIAPLIAQHLAKFHSIPLQDHNQKPSLIPLTRKFVELIMNSPHHPEDFISLCSDIDWIENEILPNMIPNPQYGSDLVLCHNDLVCTNILYNSSSQTISFIDFEYCAVNYALFDIANHFVEYAGVHQIHFERYPTRDEQIRWLNIYFEARNLKFDNPEKTCQTIDQFSVLTHLYIGLWAFTQLAFAKVDSDYESYGRRRLNRYKELKFILFNR